MARPTKEASEKVVRIQTYVPGKLVVELGGAQRIKELIEQALKDKLNIRS